MSDRSTSPVYLDVGRAQDMLGDAEAVRKILVTAQSVLRTEIPRMRESMQAGDVAAAGRVLHTLKGMAPIFCSDALVERVTAGERLSKSAGVQDFLPVYEGVEQTLAQLLAEMEAYLGQTPGPGMA